MGQLAFDENGNVYEERERKYKVGDRVKIKSWEQMESEFGVDSDGSIKCDVYFVEHMRKYCEKTLTICKIYRDVYKMKEDIHCYSFSDDMIEGLADEEQDNVNHPSHYCQEGSMECIDEMVAIFGKKAVRNFCIMNVWKYRKRAIFKNGKEDMKKSDWYMKKFIELGGKVVE